MAFVRRLSRCPHTISPGKNGVRLEPCDFMRVCASSTGFLFSFYEVCSAVNPQARSETQRIVRRARSNDARARQFVWAKQKSTGSNNLSVSVHGEVTPWREHSSARTPALRDA